MSEFQYFEIRLFNQIVPSPPIVIKNRPICGDVKRPRQINTSVHLSPTEMRSSCFLPKRARGERKAWEARKGLRRESKVTKK